jgi:DNA-directed RNA polymerase
MRGQTVTIQNKMDRQLALEAEMRQYGVERYRRNYDKAVKGGRAAETEPGLALMKATVMPVSKCIEEWRTTCASGKAGRRHSAYKLVSELSNDTIAFIAVKVVFNEAIKNSALTATSGAVGKALEDELWCSRFQREEKRLYNNVKKNLSKRRVTGIANKREMMKRVAEGKSKKPFSASLWTDREMVIVGALFTEMVVTVTGFFETPSIAIANTPKIKKVLRLSPKAAKWLDDRKIRGELLRPLVLPMLIPPQPREGSFDGKPYYTEGFRHFPLVKRRRDKSNVDPDADYAMPEVLKAVNRLDQTAWKISTEVLEVLEVLWDNNHSIAGLPSREEKPMPERPEWMKKMAKKHGGDRRKMAKAKRTLPEAKQQEIATYRKAAAEVHEFNNLSRSKRCAIERLIEVANRFKNEPAMYFPHDLDFRGRIYDIPTGLHPQGADYSRGLLLFAEGKPVNNSDAMRWLMIHGANTFGEDKVDMNERVRWVEKNLKRIKAVVKDPLKNLWWTEAEKPFGFLQWCFDYAGVLEGKPSHVPIAMDGSCNGLQHFSAMLRDKEGGAAVNLVPTDKPSDIYAEVARETEVMLQEIVDAEGDNVWLAETWLSIGINRKITKRSTMVMPYGGTTQTTLDYVKEAWAEIREAKGNPFGQEDNSACVFLGVIVHRAIRRVVKKAALAMSWLQAVARICAKSDTPLRWTTPSGFVALQRYPNMKGRQIETHLLGKLRKIYVEDEGPGLDVNEMTTGIAPNFVHSLDAAALILTVNAAAEGGVTHFAMIHDSYGTHAADTNQLAYTLREQFVKMYTEHDVLKEFLDEVKTYLPKKDWAALPPIPETGTLNLKLVLDSEFFFA